MDRPEQVVADADTALYHAKTHGRGRWSFFTAQMHADSIATKQLATELLLACDRREFIPYFQPIIDAETGIISSAEVAGSYPCRGNQWCTSVDFYGPDTKDDAKSGTKSKTKKTTAKSKAKSTTKAKAKTTKRSTTTKSKKRTTAR